jgi:membrane protein required for colicin V production
VLVLVAGLTPLPKATWWREALLAPPFETVVLAAKPWMPQELARRIGYR